MSDLKRYIVQGTVKDTVFAQGVDTGYGVVKINVLLHLVYGLLRANRDR